MLLVAIRHQKKNVSNVKKPEKQTRIIIRSENETKTKTNHNYFILCKRR